MEMMYYQVARSSYQDSLKVLEADIQYANALAAAIPRTKGGAHLQMKLVYNQLAPLLLFFLQWIDCSCTCLLPRYLNLFNIFVYKVYTDGGGNISRHGRKASIKDFYAVILPSLRRLHNDLEELENFKYRDPNLELLGKKRVEGHKRCASTTDLDREDECGICLEACTKMVMPNCCHEMCINCYRDWNTRSESCPFCRGSLKRVNSEDLWVLTCNDDVIATEMVSREDLLQFYLYINSLPKDSPDDIFLRYYEYII